MTTEVTTEMTTEITTEMTTEITPAITTERATHFPALRSVFLGVFGLCALVSLPLAGCSGTGGHSSSPPTRG